MVRRVGRSSCGRAVLTAAIVVLIVSGVSSADTLGLTPQAPSPEFTRAVTLLGRGNLRQADALFQQLVEKDPGQVYAALGRAQVAISEQRLADAARAIAAIVEKQPNLPEARNMSGLVLMLQNRFGDARKEFDRALMLAPRYVTPRIYLAAMSRAQGNLVEATVAYKAVADAAPRLPVGYLGQAEAQMMLRRDDEAFAALAAWKTAVPGSARPSQVLANVYLARGEHQKAIDELRSALNRRPADSVTVAILADAYVQAGDTREAADQYERALALSPANIDAALRLGNLRIKAGDHAGAIEAFRAVLKVQPAHAGACNDIAWLLVERGTELGEALKLALLATKAEPKYVDAHDTLGWIRFRRGEYAQSVAALTAAKTLAPDRADIAAHLGLAYAKLGRNDLALSELRRALAHPGGLTNRAEVDSAVARLSRSEQR